MNETEQRVQQLEITIDQAEKWIADRDKFKRLSENQDFKDLITKGYFEDRARELVLTRGNPAIISVPGELEAILKDIDGIASFWQYIQGIINLGAKAEADLQAYNESMDELLDITDNSDQDAA